MSTVLDGDRRELFSSTNLFVWVFFAILLLFPIVRVSGIPVPVVLVLFPLCFRMEIPRIYLYTGAGGTVALAILTAINALRNTGLTAADLSYFPIPIAYVVLIFVSVAIFQRERDTAQTLHVFWKVFLVSQFFVAVVQLFNPLDVLSIVEPYTRFLGANVGPNARYGDAILLQRRPGGLITVSTWLGVAGYAVGRWLTTYTGAYRYVVYSAALTLVTAARMAMIIILVTETVLLVYNLGYGIPELVSVRTLIGILPAVAVLGIASLFHPYLSPFTTALLEGEFISMVIQNKSVQHRITSYTYLFDRPGHFVLGGLVLREVPFAFDSEFVMRTLQFGVIGYIAFKLPILAFLVRSLRYEDHDMRRMAIVLVSIVFAR